MEGEDEKGGRSNVRSSSCVQMEVENIVHLNYMVTLVMRVLTRFTAATSLPTPAR